MPRDPSGFPHPPSGRPQPQRPHRPSQPATGRSWLSWLAQAEHLNEVLPRLHQHALTLTRSQKSLLLQYDQYDPHDPRTRLLCPTSGSGLQAVAANPLNAGPDETALVDDLFEAGRPRLVGDAYRQMPTLADRVGLGTLLLIPIARRAQRLGLLALGFARPPAAARAALAGAQQTEELADAFLVTLEVFGRRQREQEQRDLRDLLNAFDATLSITLDLTAGLETFCRGANRLLGCDRTSVWIHDRRAGLLVLRGSSDQDHAARGTRVTTDDPLSPAAAAMRRARAEIAVDPRDGRTPVMTVPLRGTRRSLGTMVVEGLHTDRGRGAVPDHAVLDRADEMGRRLSSAIETMHLLDDVLRSRRELENTFDSIADLVAVADRTGRIVHVNVAFADRVSSSRVQLVGRPLGDYIGPELRAWIGEYESDPGSHGEVPSTREFADSALHGRFLVTITDRLSKERERVGCVIVARDLTPQIRLEAEREELRRRLMQSEKLAALGQFVAGIAHELNNPLQGVLGHIELLRTVGAFPKHLRREVQMIYREADRAARIIHNLLVFAGSRRPIRRRVNVNAVLQKVVSLRAPAFRAADIEVVRHYDDRLPRVASDPLLLHQAFLNIVMNAEQAVAAAGRGGRIEITTSASPSTDRVIITIRDTGAGIPADSLSRIFEPFYTTKEVGKGTGLGLAIAYGIVQEHGGQIAAANHPDGGAVFTVELPAQPAPRRNR